MNIPLESSNNKRDRENENDEESVASKRTKADEDDKLSSALCNLAGGDEEDGLQIKVDTTPVDEYSINLWDAVYRKDRSPLVSYVYVFGCVFHTLISQSLVARLSLCGLLISHKSLYPPFTQITGIIGRNTLISPQSIPITGILLHCSGSD